MHHCKYLSLVLDESTDVTNFSQLLIFTRAIDSSFEVHKELLKLMSLHDTSNGKDVFVTVNSVISKHGGFDKFSKILHSLHHFWMKWVETYRCALRSDGWAAGSAWRGFFALCTEIPVFLEENIRCDASAYSSKLRATDFLCDIAFLAGITSHLNHLNVQLQGRDQTVSDLYASMNGFQHNLALSKAGFLADHPNLVHFACEEMCKDVPDCENTLELT